MTKARKIYLILGREPGRHGADVEEEAHPAADHGQTCREVGLEEVKPVATRESKLYLKAPIHIVFAYVVYMHIK